MSKINIDEIEDAVRSKIHTPESFHLALIELVESRKAANLIEAIGVYCQENDLSGEEVAPLVDEPLKAKLHAEAVKTNLIRGVKRAELPL